MLKTLSLALALGFSSVAIAQQQPDPAKPDAKAESPAATVNSAAGATRPRCDFMSREEMQMCQRTKKGDASGVRSSLCDTVGADVIESCLKQQQPASSDAASEVKDPEQPR